MMDMLNSRMQRFDRQPIGDISENCSEILAGNLHELSESSFVAFSDSEFETSELDAGEIDENEEEFTLQDLERADSILEESLGKVSFKNDYIFR